MRVIAGSAKGTRLAPVPEGTRPLSDRARALWLRLDCSPCFERTCPLGHHRCLRELSPAMVADALEAVAAPVAGPAP